MDFPEFKCNVCGYTAEYMVSLELIKKGKRRGVFRFKNDTPFYLCKRHEYLYDKMSKNIELKDLFTETIKELQ